MANRHLARSVVMQTLFELDFNEGENQEPLAILNYNIEEFAPGLNDDTFMSDLVSGVVKKKNIIDDIIGKAAPEWPVEKINAVDRNVLRLGLYELLFGDYTQTPPKVAINEAIELAKSFGGESSGRFVNGVLGAVYREIGEPEKDQKSKRQRDEDIDPATLPVEPKVGAVVYGFDDSEELQLLMVHDVFGFWTLSKGSALEDEELNDAVVRKVKEETAVDVKVVDQIGENEYIANHPEKGKIRKHVYYFLAEAEAITDPHLDEEDPGGLDDVRWFPVTDVVDLRMYDDVTQLIADAAKRLLDSDDSDTVSE